MEHPWPETLAAHLRVMELLRTAGPTLDAIADATIAAFHAGGRLYVCGNGGSAADAQHIAGELLGRFKRDRRALPALALSTDTSTLTAIANDMGYERVFARQLEGLLRPGDVVWLLSTSGNSPNILAAAQTARARGAFVAGFSGASGGRLAALCDVLLRVPHDASDRIQEGHMLAYHYLCERVESAFCA
jgi:D-sedoheptulose 7-phosphate isomerase